MLLPRLLLVATTANAWQRWEYKSDATQQWRELWGLERGPGARRGHSLVMHHKPATDTEKATTKIVLFGGRSNEIFKQHVPKTYEIKISSGTIDFVSYDKSPIKTEMCTTDPDTGEQVCRNPINVGLYFNDVWAYELECSREGATPADKFCGGVFGTPACFDNDPNEMDQPNIFCKDQAFKECELPTFGASANYDPQTGSGPCPQVGGENANKKSWACMGSDLPCEDQSWKELDYGARRGGCRYVLGREVCTHPSERWRHGASMFDDSTMLVYGGFSQRCEDYCDDLWAFDVRDNTWMEIYEVGKFAFGDAPGKRWRFSLVSDGQRYPCPKALEEQNQDEIECGRFYIFGGFRLWHGFARDNSEDNRWRSNEELPDGGYMDDLWVYNKRLLNPDEPMPTSSAGLGLWRNYTGKATCVDEPGATWEGRDDQNCEVEWPTARAGHTSALDAKNGGVYVFGGYTTFFPYLSTDGPGSGWGAAAKPNAKGFIPFPDYPYYLNDLWVYNLTTGYWTLLTPLSTVVPAPRTDMSMILDMGYCRSSVDDDGACFGPMLIVFGGYNGSHHFDDTWLFDTRKTRWLEKRQQVHPLWPPGCTDDDEIIANSSCFLLDYAQPVRPDGLIQAQRHDLDDLFGGSHVVVDTQTKLLVDPADKGSAPLVGTNVWPAQLVGGAAACASEADEGCAGFDWWSLDPNNTKMVHLLNMAVCSHDRMMSCRVDGDCSFYEASSKCIKKSKYIEFSAFPFYGIVDKDGPRPDPSVDKPKYGDPIVKYAATGPNQWVTGPRYWDEDWLKDHFRRRDCGTKQFDDRDCAFWSQDLSRDVAFLENYTVSYNKSLPEIKSGKKFHQDFEAYRGVYYRRCTSVYGDATRGGTLGWHPKAPDGLNGRANGSVLIPQKRRRAPGWDGCRDTCFGVHPNEPGLYPGERQKYPDRFECPSNASLILDTGLQYLRPNQRSDHAAILVPHLGRWTTNTRALGEIYMFGGVGYGVEQKQTTDHTFPSVVLDDMWRLGVHDCPNNCNNQGNCSYGFCQCHRGYYGADCSNISCPGDFCYVDQDTNEQVCQHCCQAGYNHTDHDKYQVDVPRVPCTFASHRQDGSFGESNGICDGFGTCQCAPPFINDDCSIRDCDHNCSHRGHCSVEFPVSRCICDPGYYGKHCQYQVCLNNCSYPNGLCNHTTGLCTCEMIYSPYQNWRPYQRWGGEDCSFLWAYCAACRGRPSTWWVLILSIAWLRR